MMRDVYVEISAKTLARSYRHLRKYILAQDQMCLFFESAGCRALLEALHVEPPALADAQLQRHICAHDLQVVDQALADLVAAVPPGTLDEPDAD